MFDLRHSAKRAWREWIKPLALFFLIMAPLRSAIVDWNWVPTGSMKPTILEGDLVLVNKLAYDLKVPFTTRHLATWGGPQRGDVAVLLSPRDGTRLVKRVVGLPGDCIEMKGDILSVNGVEQETAIRDSKPYLREMREDSHPLVAMERLGERSHLIAVLPSRAALRTFGPYVVPVGTYFMMGDSRDNSFDSRFFGPVARGQILGKAAAVVVSFDTSRWLRPRFDRILRSLDAE